VGKQVSARQRSEAISLSERGGLSSEPPPLDRVAEALGILLDHIFCNLAITWKGELVVNKKVTKIANFLTKEQAKKYLS